MTKLGDGWLFTIFSESRVALDGQHYYAVILAVINPNSEYYI